MTDDPIETQGEQRWFTSHDGTPIGYQVVGNPDGVPFLLANGVGGTHAAYRFIIRRFQHAFRFYCWDYRGLYTSGRPLRGYDALTVADHAQDCRALLDHVGIEKCFAFGWSMGVTVLLEATRHVGDRFTGLVLHNGVASRLWDGLGAVGPLGPRVVRALQAIDGLVTKTVHFTVDWPPFVPIAIRMGLAHHDLQRDVFVDIARGFKKLDMHLYLEILQRLGIHDCEDVLAGIRCPTLLLASTSDPFVPLKASRALHERIADSTLEVIPGGSHYAAVEFPELVNEKIEAFFRARFPDVPI
jgi:pimeloyl-ACP methyl ester carboxylesterase